MEYPIQEGWWRSPLANGKAKYHYYNEKGMSLCGKYYLFIAPKAAIHYDPDGYFAGSEDSCKTCSKKLVASNEKRERNGIQGQDTP